MTNNGKKWIVYSMFVDICEKKLDELWDTLDEKEQELLFSVSETDLLKEHFPEFKIMFEKIKNFYNGDEIMAIERLVTSTPVYNGDWLCERSPEEVEVWAGNLEDGVFM